jgi:hypothetical protein
VTLDAVMTMAADRALIGRDYFCVVWGIRDLATESQAGEANAVGAWERRCRHSAQGGGRL